VGKKMAEKILVELQSLVEKGLLIASGGGELAPEVDEDALEALTRLGYDRRTIVLRLRELPKDVRTTEDRVKRVLQALA
jgi:Holliday junction resolvasome RuvABC DNA-binding subunit